MRNHAIDTRNRLPISSSVKGAENPVCYSHPSQGSHTRAATPQPRILSATTTAGNLTKKQSIRRMMLEPRRSDMTTAGTSESATSRCSSPLPSISHCETHLSPPPSGLVLRNPTWLIDLRHLPIPIPLPPLSAFGRNSSFGISHVVADDVYPWFLWLVFRFGL
jgi:hypothetical protein